MAMHAIFCNCVMQAKGCKRLFGAVTIVTAHAAEKLTVSHTVLDCCASSTYFSFSIHFLLLFPEMLRLDLKRISGDPSAFRCWPLRPLLLRGLCSDLRRLMLRDCIDGDSPYSCSSLPLLLRLVPRDRPVEEEEERELLDERLLEPRS